MAVDPFDTRPFDAVLLLSFGGPERPEDVVPFLEIVTRGRGIPKERLAVVGQHYFDFGGRSPINDQNRALVAALEASLAARGEPLPVYWGNRNWAPFVEDAMAAMARDGVRHAAVVLTSAYSSYSGCRSYREHLDRAVAATPGAPALTKVRAYHNHPGFAGSFAEAMPAGLGEDEALLFVTHSIPEAMNAASGADGGAYERQHRQVAAHLAQGRPHELVYCSKSGDGRAAWLEPDVNVRIEQLAAEGVRGVTLVPIGFVSDHMEVVYDLDTQARATAERLGLGFRRLPTPGTSPLFVDGLTDLIEESAALVRGEQVHQPVISGTVPLGPWCGEDCCHAR